MTGIDIYVHGTFFLLLAFVAFSNLIAGRTFVAMLSSLLLVVAVFTTVVLHEFGHALMARRFGVSTRDITLLPIGGIARLDELPDKPSEQLVVAVAGPAVNFAIAALLLGVVRVIDGPLSLDSFRWGDGSFLTQLMLINVSLALFNLLPGYPMDGGRILRALLAMRMAPEQATQLAARVGQGVAIAFAVVGFLVSPMLILIAVFVWLGAKAEHSVSSLRVALAGLSVRQAMITDFKALALTDPLAHAVELTLAGFQQDFPVMDGVHIAGILTHADLLQGVATRGAGLLVREAMRGEIGTASPSETLDGALNRMRAANHRVLMVVEDEALVGLVTLANIGEIVALKEARRHRGERQGMSREDGWGSPRGPTTDELQPHG